MSTWTLSDSDDDLPSFFPHVSSSTCTTVTKQNNIVPDSSDEEYINEDGTKFAETNILHNFTYGSSNQMNNVAKVQRCSTHSNDEEYVSLKSKLKSLKQQVSNALLNYGKFSPLIKTRGIVIIMFSVCLVLPHPCERHIIIIFLSDLYKTLRVAF